MTDIKPPDGNLLTDRDVDYALFRCCGDEDLIFLRCPKCGHIWVECYECSNWFVDLETSLDRLVDELRVAGWFVYRLPPDTREPAAFSDGRPKQVLVLTTGHIAMWWGDD